MVSADPVVMCGVECMKMCRFVCIVANQLKLESVAPYGKCFAAYYLRNGKVELRGRVVDVMYQCATCGLCKEWCLPGVDVPEIVKEERARIFERGAAPGTILELSRKVESERNPYGEPHAKRFEVLSGKMRGKGKVAYFVGCTAAYRQPEIAKATAKILERVEGGFKLIGDEWCCGAPLLSAGHRKLAMEHAEHNRREVEKSGCEIVVTSCAGCYMALSREYPKLGFPLGVEVLHLSQYLWRAISEGKIELRDLGRSVSVTYHDPCHLGRRMSVYEEPRSVLSSIPGVRLLEMEWSRKNAKCCGRGGVLYMNFPELSRKIGAERVMEAAATGAEVLVTACPFCKSQLESLSESRITVCDVSEFVARCL